MHPDAERIEELFIKSFHGELTREERLELEVFLEQFASLRSLYAEMIEGEGLFQKDLGVLAGIGNVLPRGRPVAKPETQETRIREAKTKEALTGETDAGRGSITRRIRRLRPVAAILALVAAASVFTWYFLSHNSSADIADISQRYQNDVAAGKDMAVLTLGDGSTILLDSTISGVLARQSNTRIRKVEDGGLVYELAGKAVPAAEIAYNTVTTPPGGQYHVVLPDGTGVWLNAGSFIRFPSVFTGAERHVEVSGEVYFEVARNKDLPFTVQVGDRAEIKVLGTHFNVMAYKDEAEIKTTLLEGSVEVKANGRSSLLDPGQQALLTSQGELLTLKGIDVRKELAWKEGYFQFEDASIEMIMRQVARWYDVEVDYEGIIAKKFTVLMLSRELPVSSLLELLELTGNVHFKIEGRRIIVLP